MPIGSATSKKSAALWLLIGMSACVGAGSAVAEPAARTIRIVADNSHAPFSFESEDGALQGIAVDQWQAWERATGLETEIHAMDWPEALRLMSAGEFDVIEGIVATPTRGDSFDFTPAYATIETAIFFRGDAAGISNLESLKGFPVGVKSGAPHNDALAQHGVAMVPFPNNRSLVEAARQHKINVFVTDAPSAIYLLNKLGIAGEFRYSPPIFHDELRRAVRKGDADTLRVISSGFAAIDPAELTRIDRKWYGSPVDSYRRYFSFAAYASAIVTLILLVFVAWNRTLAKGILLRTAQLEESEARLRRVAEDVKALSEEREAHLRTVIDTIPTMVWSLTADGKVDFVNQRWIDYTGISLLQALEQPNSIVHTDDLPGVYASWLEQMANGEPHQSEMRLRRADGEYRWFLVRTVPLRNACGDVAKWYGTCADIEDRKCAESELRSFNEQLQASSRRLVDLQEAERKGLSRELHDRIGQDLTALGINVEILRSSPVDDPSGTFRARLQDCAALIDAMAIAVESLMSELRPPLLDDHGLLPALDWYAREYAERTGIRVEVGGDSHGNRVAPAAEIALFRVAQEALTNIAKHARATHVAINIDHSATELRLSIADDGSGFDAAIAFDVQLWRGLGLTTMRERTEAVGGRFDVLTAPGRGTGVLVRIPLLECPSTS